MKKTRLWILCGGKSAEHDVSLVSAKFIYETLDRARFSPELVYIDPLGLWRKAPAKILASRVAQAAARPRFAGRPMDIARELGDLRKRPDAIFPVLHGPHGEDGTLQGLLDIFGVPYVGCGVFASAAGMDKEMAKRLAAEAGIPIAAYRVARSLAQARAGARALGFPLFVKPARQGSSVGVSRAANPGQLAAAVKEALRYDDKVLLEKAVPRAREIECAVLGDPALPAGHPLRLKASICGEVVPNTEFYSYASKYLDLDGSARYIPARISAAQTRRARELSLAAFGAIDGYAMGRVDFLMDPKSGRLYFNEINTIPGFTSASMYPNLWRASGVPPKRLIERLVGLALRRGRARNALLTAPPRANAFPEGPRDARPPASTAPPRPASV